MKKLSLVLFFLLFTGLLFALEGTNPPKNKLTVAFYNVENLFDTIKTEGFRDEDFTPEGRNAWNSERYFKKINDLGRVISELNPDRLPEIVGLCEVENREVLTDLVQSEFLHTGEYEIIHETGPDARGIDVALIYRKDFFQYISHSTIPVRFDFAPDSRTRDILYVKGKASETDTFHLFVNHWSSRIGGEAETEPRRIVAAMKLRDAVDSLLSVNPEAKILIMGDFNDEPTNTSIFSFLNANNKRKNYTNEELYNLMYDLHNQHDEGSFFFRGKWNMLDQVIVSRAFLQAGNGFYMGYDDGRIFRAPWKMTVRESDTAEFPFRTFAGGEYLGGISDHLPVYVILTHD
jgi:predicted extracellular nuclease